MRIGAIAMAIMAVLNTPAVKKAIETQGVGWEAGRTKFDGMSRAELEAYVQTSGIVTFPMVGGLVLEELPGEELPASFTWRDWMTPVKDQGPCGSCWAFSAIATVEAAYRIELDEPNRPVDLSEQYCLSCLAGGCDGGFPETVFTAMTLLGVPDEECFQYRGWEKSCSGKCQDWASRTYGIVDYRWISPVVNGEDVIRSHLQEGPMVTTMSVYEDFYSYRRGTYEHVWGDRVGLHAVALIGYDDERSSWQAKNSWGTDWGEEGYFEITRGDSGFGAYLVQPYVDADKVPDITDPPIKGCGCSMVR